MDAYDEMIVANRGDQPTYKELESELSASQARESALREKLEVVTRERNNAEISKYPSEGARIYELERALSECNQRMLAAETRIKASQEQEPFDYVYRGTEPVPTFLQPPIPPELAELQRENAELRKLLESKVPEFALELPDGDNRTVEVWFVEKRGDGKWHISISVDAQPKEPKQ